MVTYLEFLAAFLAVPIAALLAATRLRGGGRGLRWDGLAVIVALALVYTVPWDNYLIARGVWWYGDGRVALTIGRAPLGEYLFIVLQPVLTALWLAQLPAGWQRPAPRVATDGGSPRGPLRSRLGLPLGRGRLPGSADVRTALHWLGADRLRPRVAALAAAAGIGFAGAAMLERPGTFYLGAILAWAAPVLAVQWLVGATQLWRRRRLVGAGVLAPMGYLWLADRYAIAEGIWTLSARYTTGIAPGGLPVEEATFFLVTNLFVVQGLVLFRWVVRRWP